MSVQSNIRKRISRLSNKAKRIFKITYEDMTAHIFYDAQNTFALQLCRTDNCLPEEVLLMRPISREQAFHMMNTRS